MLTTHEGKKIPDSLTQPLPPTGSRGDRTAHHFSGDSELFDRRWTRHTRLDPIPKDEVIAAPACRASVLDGSRSVCATNKRHST